MIDGGAKIEVYEVDGSEPQKAQFLDVALYPLDGQCSQEHIVLLKFDGRTLAVSIEELLSAVAAIQVIAKAR